MPDDIANAANGAFIRPSLRPATLPYDERPPVEPGTSPDELRRRAGELLPPALRDQLNAANGSSSQPGRQTIYSPSPQVVFTTVDAEAVLLHLRSGVYYSLNRVGTVVWDLLSDQQPLEAVCSNLCGRFDVSAEVAWSDLSALVGELCREELVIEKA